MLGICSSLRQCSGEIGLVPTAGAVANALYQYDGVRRTKLPMALPEREKVVVRSGNGAAS